MATYPHGLYVAGDVVGSWGGGGSVTGEEHRALTSVCESITVLDGTNLLPPVYRGVGIPFLQDYFAAERIASTPSPGKTLTHFYSNGFAAAVVVAQCLGPVTYTSPAHSRRLAIEEYSRALGWDGSAYPFPHIYDDYLWKLHSQGIQRADAVISPSYHSQQVLNEEVGVVLGRIRVIPHGYTPSVDPPLPYPSQFRAGYLGMVGPDKGLRYLIEAWSALDLTDAMLFLAGPSTDLLGPLIQAQAQKGHYATLGMVENPATLYDSISVYVQPSVTEGFGIPVLEAMGRNRPVIVSEGAGAAWVVRDGVDGFVVPRRDPKAITERLKWFHDNPAKIEQMGVAAGHQAREFTWDKVRPKYIALFQELL